MTGQPTPEQVLDVPLDPGDAATEGETVRGYLKRGGRLSGGDNTWKWPLYVALAEAGLLPGVAVDPADADGDVLGNFPEAAQAQADGLIAAAAKTLARQCVFCDRIQAGRFNRTCSTPDVVVFEPLHPVTPGHLLIVPRTHVDDATEDPALTGLVFAWAAELADRSVHASNLITSIGRDATQSVFHLHVHLVPRIAEDGLHLPWTGQKRAGVTP